MDANRRVINRLEELYSLYGAGDRVDSLVSRGDHAYREDIRRAAYRFINLHLKNDPRPVEDSEIDLVTGPRNKRRHPIPPEKLRVFPRDVDIPTDELNTTIDRHFVPLAHPETPAPNTFETWKSGLLAELRRITFRYFSARIPPARLLEQISPDKTWLTSESPIKVHLQTIPPAESTQPITRLLLVVQNADSPAAIPPWLDKQTAPGDRVYLCTPRGFGPTRWTRKNPPNYVERSHVLLGRTVDTGRVWDIIAAARYLIQQHNQKIPLFVLGEGPAGILATYAALWEPDVAGVIVNQIPLSHMDNNAPQFLNILRVCDIPDTLGLIAPRPLTILAATPKPFQKTIQIYSAAGAAPHLIIKSNSKN